MLKKRVLLMVHVLAIAFRLRPVATAVLIALMIVEAVSATVLAVVQGQLIQRAPVGFGPQVVVSIALAALLVVALVVSYRVMWTLRRDVSDAVELVLIEDLLTWTTRPATVDHVQDPVFLDRLSVVVRRSNGLGHAAWSAVMLVCSSFSVITSLVVLARISWPLVLLSVLAVPPILLAGRSGDLYMQAIDKNADLLRLEDQLTKTVTDAGSLKELMVSGSAPTVDARAGELWKEMAHHEWVARGWAVILTSAGWLIYGTGTAVALGWVISLARSGQATIGDVGVVAGLAVYLAQQIMNVLSFRVQVADSGRVIDHYGWIRERTAELAPAATALTRIEDGVELVEVGYTYPGAATPSLSGLTLRIPAGTVLGVVGVNGAGKSTLARLLTGLSTPTAGRLAVDGRSVRPGELSGAASGAFQDYARLELRAEEAVGTAGLDGASSEPDRRGALDAAAHAGGADAVVARLDDGWDTQLGATFDGAQLSQGQWQRLALSRGLFKAAPVVLVLDEPTAALDPQSEHDLFEAFAGRARRAATANGAITVLVSHRFSTVTMTDLIIVLDDGRLVEQGTHAELMAADGTYRQLFEAQAQGYADAEPSPQV